MKRSWFRAFRALGSAALASALLAWPAVPSASAHGGDPDRPTLTCAGSATIRFEPGLTLRTRHSSIGGAAGYLCSGTDPRVTSAQSVIKGAGETSCLSVSSTAVEWVTWNTGEHSKILYTRRNLVQPVAGETVALVEGTVVEGKYRGRPVASPGLQGTLNLLDCASHKGVEEIKGPTTLLFL
ncbi:hypothetical protein ACIHFE_31180 [Streptomyces sp. NPDC052396]|uniref:hypothetical protein n=1 Tax=Streptomyces sp. NPDC052396 TaxID=3365689 RepID=UPI0037D14DB5